MDAAGLRRRAGGGEQDVSRRKPNPLISKTNNKTKNKGIRTVAILFTPESYPLNRRWSVLHYQFPVAFCRVTFVPLITVMGV